MGRSPQPVTTAGRQGLRRPSTLVRGDRLFRCRAPFPKTLLPELRLDRRGRGAGGEGDLERQARVFADPENPPAAIASAIPSTPTPPGP